MKADDFIGPAGPGSYLYSDSSPPKIVTVQVTTGTHELMIALTRLSPRSTFDQQRIEDFGWELAKRFKDLVVIAQGM